MTESANKYLRFSSDTEDVEFQKLHLPVYEDVTTIETVYETALVRWICCQAEGSEDAEYD